MEHISLLKLLEYIDGKICDDELIKFETHLNDCKACKKLFDFFKSFEKQACLFFSEETNPTPDCPDDVLLAGYLDGRVKEEEKQKVSQHIKECDRCFSHLAFYYKAIKAEKPQSLAVPAYWINSAVEQLAGKTIIKESVTGKEKISVFSLLKEKITSFTEWININFSPAPAYGVALVAILILFIGYFSQSPKIVNINSSSYLEIAKPQDDEQTSFGFMGKSEDKKLTKIKGMTASLSGKNLKLTWQSLPGTGNLYLTIKEGSGNQLKKIFKEKISGNSHLVPSFLIKPNKRYQWEISGVTANGEIFRAVSEFILNQ